MSALNPGMNPALAGMAEWRSEAGGLILGHCQACDETHYYPRAICPFCHSSDVDRVDAAGTGQVYSYCSMEKGADGPYIIAYVTLDEGITMLTHIVDADAAAIDCGTRVKLRFRDTDIGPVPVFHPA